ncbi:WXG100 family type VII secretion target [Nocardioides sp.]|uniref:WXG100 family type VII secretion target n=1 Tax=Nocardioides sp. TaxID=35761 RepID=UPI0039E717AA
MTSSTTGQVVGALDRAAGLALDAKADLDGLLTTLSGRVALGSAQWSGAGARGFRTAYAEWADAQASVTAKLQWFSDQLMAVERLNVDNDEAVSAAFRGGRR